MRAARLFQLLLVLQNNGRLTAGALARRLQVSERTVLRDVEALSGAGIPVYATRGPRGGIELLDTFEQVVPRFEAALQRGPRGLRRVRVRLSPSALQLAMLAGRPEGWRPRPGATRPFDRPDWLEGSFRFDSYQAAARELLALGAEVEVVLPVELRHTMAALGRRIAQLHDPHGAGPVDRRSADADLLQRDGAHRRVPGQGP